MNEILGDAFDKVKSRLHSQKMTEGGPPADKPYDGPCRESAFSVLKQEIEDLRRRANGLESLLTAVSSYSDDGGSAAAEEALWEVLRQRSAPRN